MTTHDRLAAREPAVPLSSWMRSIGLRLLAWVHVCANYSAAAALYEELAALSDAELARRGLSRATLAQHVRIAAD